MSKKGLFISFEGIDGSGKSTQAEILADYMRDQGFSFMLVHDPGSTAIAEEIRRLLKSAVWAAQRDEITELFLQLAARSHLWNTNICPALARGYTVIADRFSDSTFVYQGLLPGMEMDLLSRVSDLASPTPHLTFLLDIDPLRAIERIAPRSDRDYWDNATEETMAGLRQLYLEVSERYPERIKVLDGGESICRVRARILSIVRATESQQGSECALQNIWGK